MKDLALIVALAAATAAAAEEFPKPYSPPCAERENVFEFAEKPKVRSLGNDKYEITFAVRGNCDATVGLIDEKGLVVRHLGAGVLGANAPLPFQKNSLKQTITWNGKDDLDVYVKEPGKLRVRVMLGLKPEFDKRLGGASPCNLPGMIWGFAASPDGVLVGTIGLSGALFIRQFDHEGLYVRTIWPPPANLPEEKLGGMSFIEYEPGKKALQSPDVQMTTSSWGHFQPCAGVMSYDCQPVLAGGRFYYCNAADKGPSMLFYLYPDGSTDLPGIRGRPLIPGQGHLRPRLAASPDGKWIYMPVGGSYLGGPLVFRAATDGSKPAEPFFGRKAPNGQYGPASDNDGFNNPLGIDCDSAGRIYVADSFNNRIQIISPDGKYLKSIPIDRPSLVRVHQKTGAIYVLHMGRVSGQSTGRVTKFTSFDNPRDELRADGLFAAAMAVDSWAAKPRIWLGGKNERGLDGINNVNDFSAAEVWEETGDGFRRLLQFDEAARKEDGEKYVGRWSGFAFGTKVTCDPTRERLYYNKTHMVDLNTGRYLGLVALPYAADDITFDKKGYTHIHFNPGFYMPGVGRQDPSQGKHGQDHTGKFVSYSEVPYDYGLEVFRPGTDRWLGILPVRDQPGAKYFQDGIGVNMRGDVAVESNIYHIPKMEEAGRETAMGGPRSQATMGGGGGSGMNYAAFLHLMQDWEKEGREIFFIRRQPGIPLGGGTIWTFDSTGELRGECAVLAGDLINGVQMDEESALYFVNGRTRLFGQKPFLAGRGGTFGAPEDNTNRNPFTGTLIKTIPRKQCLVLLQNAPVPLDQLPQRPADMWKGQLCWVEGAQWLYAGASPIVAGGCSCPNQRLHMDWYKRTYVPETYRHSIGILDTNGNLIMHLGRYGNLDSADGPKSKIPVGGDEIGITIPRYVSGTDNYLCFSDLGDRIMLLKLNYCAEETVGISNQ